MPRLIVAPGFSRAETLALGVVVAFPERAIEQGIEIYFLLNQLSGGSRLAFANKISPPELFRSQIQGARHLIQMALQRENTLRRAEAAKCAVRRGVGRHGLRLDAHIGAEVRPGRMNRAAREHHGRKRRVRTPINHKNRCP